MGNNPASYFDPDGGFDTKLGAWWYSLWNGGTVGGNREDGFTVSKTINDGDPSQGILNSVEVVTGRDPNQIDLGSSPNADYARAIADQQAANEMRQALFSSGLPIDGIEPVYPETYFFPSAPIKGLQASRVLYNATRASVPGYVKIITQYIVKNGAPRGYRGGRTFRNDGRGGGQTLPRLDPNGRSITYKEYDVHPHTRGVNRGAERVVIGSDGKKYYTNDHYNTFIEF